MTGRWAGAMARDALWRCWGWPWRCWAAPWPFSPARHRSSAGCGAIIAPGLLFLSCFFCFRGAVDGRGAGAGPCRAGAGDRGGAGGGVCSCAALSAGGARVGGAGSLSPLDRAWCDRFLCRLDRGGGAARGGVRELWDGRQPAADVGHGVPYAGHGDRRRVARPGAGDRRGDGLGPEAQGRSGPGPHPRLGWRARRGLGLRDVDGGGASWARQARPPRRFQRPAGGRPVDA